MTSTGVRAADRGFLLVRRGGVLWGIANGAVQKLTRQGTQFRIAMGGTELGVDEVVGVVPDLVVRPVAGALRRFWPDLAGGLAVHAQAPLVIVDPLKPPRALTDGIEGEVTDGEGRH